MLSIDNLRAWGANVSEGLARCMNNEAFYFRMIKLALADETTYVRLRAALDVFETEPLPADDTLWDCPNLLMAPHVAGNMTLPYTKDRIVDLFLEDFEHYCSGAPLARKVDLKRGY